MHPKEKDKGTDNGTVLSYWGVEDVHKGYHSLIEMGATKHEESNDVGGEILLATVYDP